jgi:DNA-binding response OmpR family regulator
MHHGIERPMCSAWCRLAAVTARRRVLVLDDDPAIARTLRRAGAVLDEIDLCVVETEEQARAELGAGRFDHVLCDWHLGTRTSEALIHDLFARRVRVAVLTADPKGAVLALGLRVPVLAKPIQLAAAIEELEGDV